MSDFDTERGHCYDRTAGRATPAIDQGLRSYMLHIYNYMTLGLAITGLAALGIYMLSITGDAASAAKVLRNGAEVPAAIRGGMFLTPLGYALFLSPLKWVVMLSPLALVFVISFGVERFRPATAQLLFWVFAALMGISLSSIFMVFTHTSITRVFFITAATFGALEPVGLHHAARHLGLGLVPVHGPDRHRARLAGQPDLAERHAAIRGVDRRRAGVCRPHRLRHPAAEERIRLRPDGRRQPRSARRSWARCRCT